MEEWTQFKPNDKLSLRAEYIPRNLEASVFLQCSMFFAPYTDQLIVSLFYKNFSSFRIDSSKSNHTAWHWRRRRLKSTCLILRHKTPIDLIWREYYNPVSQELAVWKKIISMSFSPLSFFLSAMLDCYNRVTVTDWRLASRKGGQHIKWQDSPWQKLSGSAHVLIMKKRRQKWKGRLWQTYVSCIHCAWSLTVPI